MLEGSRVDYERRSTLGLVLFLFYVSKRVQLLTMVLITYLLLLIVFLLVLVEVYFELLEYVLGRHGVIDAVPPRDRLSLVVAECRLRVESFPSILHYYLIIKLLPLVEDRIQLSLLQHLNDSTLNKKQQQKMEKQLRNRKAFYEKENDLQHCNKKKERIIPNQSKSTHLEKPYQTLPIIHPQQKSNTSSYCYLYAQELLTLTEYNHPIRQFLSHHSIDATLRSRMLDWMIEVNCSYKFTNKTYFDGVNLMDRYFKAETDSLPPSKLHIVGVQAMLIATKMQEVYPLKIKTVYQKIAHRKLPLSELIETEGRIMKTLQYKLNTWSFFDIAMSKICMFVHSKDNRLSSQKSQEQLNALQDICSYLSKFVLFDYRFYTEHPTLLIAQSIVKACFQVQGITASQNLYSSSMIIIELCKQKILQIVKGYGQRFEGLNNIFKFTPKDVISKVQQFLQ